MVHDIVRFDGQLCPMGMNQVLGEIVHKVPHLLRIVFFGFMFPCVWITGIGLLWKHEEAGLCMEGGQGIYVHAVSLFWVMLTCSCTLMMENSAWIFERTL